jgi:peptide/nickel transport system permease protein
MLAFILKRLAWGVLLAALITLITFLIFFVLLPQNQPLSNRQGIVTPNLQSQYNLEHKSLPGQYVEFLRHAVQGDFGTSLREPRPVGHTLWTTLPVTLTLLIGGTIFWLLLAFPIGLLSALRPRSLLDRGLMVLLLIGVSCHPVWLGLSLSYLLGFRLHAFPIAGYCDFAYDPSSPNQCGGPKLWAYHMLLPWFTFAFLFAALYARMIRASILETMDEDYVRTARAKGAGEWRVLRKHVLRNALLPVIAMLSMDMVVISLTGVIFIETVFQLPGIGQVLYRALISSDKPVILGVVIVVSCAVTIANLIADIVYCLVDPRLSLRGPRRQRSRVPVRWRLRPQTSVTESPTSG